MRNNQNKHGPDVDVGHRYAWLMMPVAITGQPPPWKATKDRCGPEDWPPGSSISHKRRRQRPGSTIVNRRTGESPPGFVDDLIIKIIDSITHWKRSVVGRKVAGAQTTVLTVMGGLCPEGRDKGTRESGDKENGGMGEAEKRRSGEAENGRSGEWETRRMGDGETRRQGDKEKGRQGDDKP